MTQRMRRIVDLRLHFRTGKASKYIKWALLELKPGDRVVLWCRVSSCKQKRKKNLRDQERSLRRYVEKRGGIVVDVVAVVESGWNAWSLCDAVSLAEELGAKVLAESTDRFIRHPDYHSELRPHLQPLEIHFQNNLSFAQGRAILMTVVYPDKSLSKCKGYQIKRGLREKGSKVGRPPKTKPLAKKRMRAELAPKARAMHEAGDSVRQIAKALGVSSSTVWDWIETGRSEGVRFSVLPTVTDASK